RLNFASGYPVPVAGTVNGGPEGPAEISSNAGNLLFYTDNKNIWNTNNVAMAGSAGLIGGNSSQNGALIFPRPGSSTQYYIFSVREAEQVGQPNPLRYHTIDMSLNGGLGQ